MDMVDRESHPVHLSRELLMYWLFLLRNILTSNLQMMRIILSRRLDIEPSVFVVKTAHQSDLGRVILANSITLTPGSVTLDIRDDQVEIHAITPAFAEDVLNGTLDRRVPGDVEATAPATEQAPC